MNAFASAAQRETRFLPPYLRRPHATSRAGFALVLTLIILSLLIVVAISYLTSMTNEHATANAYTAKAKAEQAAQAGAEAAQAVLAQAFRDFPDSATVWDTRQSANVGSSPSSAVVSLPYNEGTSLYLRAVEDKSHPGMAAVPANRGLAANAPDGNNPSNAACKNFVLPLISGVPGGYAQLVSNKDNIFPEKMKLSETDPAKQTYVDLNFRRYAGDLQGSIGSPPDWAGSNQKPSGPKPARAYWVNLTGGDGRLTSRYAFWVEDQSFRANLNNLGSVSRSLGQARIDNTAQPQSGGKSRSLTLADLSLPALLNAAKSLSPNDDAVALLKTRAVYPNGAFPEAAAYKHSTEKADGGSELTTTLADNLNYTTTIQSESLNVSRHGTKRLNLNKLYPVLGDPTQPQPDGIIQSAVDQIYTTLAFHLPDFGQRFHRLNTSTDSTTLNAKQVVPVTGVDLAKIYLYKVAANLCDFLDTDTQPTLLEKDGKVSKLPEILGPQEADDASPQPNLYWAHGKEASPYIQEVAVNYRPSVVTADNNNKPYPKGHFSLYIDYYIEFWNMSNRDISVDTDLHGARLWIRDQQHWTAYKNGNILEADATTQKGPGFQVLTNDQDIADWEVDLKGVVFKAGQVTLITTNMSYPQFDSSTNTKTFNYTELKDQLTGSYYTNTPSSDITANGATTVYKCPLVSPHGQRQFFGKVTPLNATIKDQGLMFGSPFKGKYYSGTEISVVNSHGYIDLVRGAITKASPNSPIYTNTDKQNEFTNYSMGSNLMGNVAGGSNAGSPTAAPSQMGDPRSNNEQIYISINPSTSTVTADGSHFVPGTRTLGYPNTATVKPDTTSAQSWSDYWTLPSTNTKPSTDFKTAPMVVADGPLTSIGQLGDVYDPARIVGPAGPLYSRGGGRTFKIGQHDDRYSPDPSGSGSSGGKPVDDIPASNRWASWRLADVFCINDDVQQRGLLNINGVPRDNGAALAALLDGWNFQPPTASGTPADPTIHGDDVSGLARKNLNSDGVAQLVGAVKSRLDPAQAASLSVPRGPMFERGELGELFASSSPIFGGNSSTDNRALVGEVNMNKVTDHGREEMFRRLSELICTRGDIFTVYVVGQSLLQAPSSGTATPSMTKVTGTHRMRVTFRLVPKNVDGTLFKPRDFGTTKQISDQVNERFVKIDHYDTQILEASTF